MMSRRLVQFLFVVVVFSGSAFQVSSQQTDQKQREVTIYFWDANSKSSDLGLAPVKRMVVAAAPLRPALEALFTGPTKEEEAKGLSSSTFGMRFEGVTLTDGDALVKFSQPANETNYGSQGPMIFAEAIEKTARQFPTVKKVEICAVGETLIDSELEKPFPKCLK
jgi:spore germination protein GerM